MRPTESGTYRVFESDRGREEWLLVDRADGEPTYVERAGYDDPFAETVAALRPGHLVEATLAWHDAGRASLTDLTVETTTLFAFVDGTPDIFEAARSTFEAATREHEPVGSQTTYGTDGDPNGVLYTIAKQDGETDVFAEIRNGRMTLEPFLDRLRSGGADPPYEVFVVRPAAEPFVVVYIAMEKGGLLANTIREEYDCPR